MMIGAGTALVATKVMTPNMPAQAAAPDPAAEREAAQAEAAQRANAKIVADQRRRRAARGLLSLGLDEQGQLGTEGGAQGRQRANSLLSLGTGAYSPSAAGAGMPGAYYGGGMSQQPRQRTQQVQ